MDSDPWADAPPSPRPSTPAKDASPTNPKMSSPLVDRQTASFSSPSSPSIPSESIRHAEAPPLHENEQQEETQVDESRTEQKAQAGTPAASPVEGSGQGGDDDFDDFDDFDQPQAGPSSTAPGLATGEGDVVGEGDVFGDFGDFEEGDFEDPVPAETQQVYVEEPEVIQQPERSWHALRLRPMPSKGDLLEQVHDLLSPLLELSQGSGVGTGVMTDEPPRQTGGLHQILVAESSREAYAQLCTPPMLKALDWTRSRVRRDHLISMGVPVNLDEVDSHRLSSLPPLRITTSMGPPAVPHHRRASVEASRYSAQEKGKARDVSPAQVSQSVPVSAVTNGNGNEEKKYGLGEKPALDVEKAEELCGVEEDQLSFMSLERLKALQDALVENSANASALLAWLLQYKDAQTQDAATYNGMISELIANAAKAKSAQNVGSGGVFRRASARQRPQSSSGLVTPGRVGSPAMR